MASRSVLRRAARARAGRDSGVTSYPWDGHVVPIDARDEAYARQLEKKAETRDVLPRVAIFGVEGRGRWFYRAGAPVLGEPVMRGGHESMDCGRGTGHLGSGLYFFGTLEAARRSAGRRDGAVYRVEGGPKNPYITAGGFDAAWKLHDFGKALICYPGEVEHYLALLQEVARIKRERDRETDGDRRYDLSDELKKAFDAMLEQRSRVSRLQLTLVYGAPGGRLESPLSSKYEDVDKDPWLGVSNRVLHAIQRYQREMRYHPMTYYMRSIGYDGVIHRNLEQFESGDIGNIWYPEV